MRHSALLPLILALIPAACSAPSYLQEFQAAMLAAPTGATAKLSLANGEILSISAPLRADLIPANVRVVANQIQPEGSMIYLAEEWGPHGHGYRMEKAYQLQGKSQVRSVLIAPDGRILARSHQILDVEANAPAKVLELANRDQAAILRIDVIQAGPEQPDLYQVISQGADGSQTVLTCKEDGSQIRRASIFPMHLSNYR